MPTYSYICENCNNEFELFFYIKDYISNPECVGCGSKDSIRDYTKDVATQSSSIKKSDSELKTIGDFANRNRDRMTDDQKIHLHQKHNSYKDTESEAPLPTGMSRMKKKKGKIKWTQS